MLLDYESSNISLSAAASDSRKPGTQFLKIFLIILLFYFVAIFL